MTASVPPLAGENHVCADCALSYADLDLTAAIDLISRVPGEARVAIGVIPPANLRRRLSAGEWSVAEYACHLRDVYVTSTIRLHRARTEERPVLEPMLNDVRARRFRYAECDVPAVLGELAAAVAGVGDELRRIGPDGWDRRVTRLPGEERTVRWL